MSVDRARLAAGITITLLVCRDGKPDDDSLAAMAVELADAVLKWGKSSVADDPYAARQLVSRWFRTRAEHPGSGIAGSIHPPITDPKVFTQLAADADHSDLLVRLFMGEEPLPYEEWLTRQRR